MGSAELEDGRRADATYDFERDLWTVTVEGRTAEGRTLYVALRELFGVRRGVVSPRVILDAVPALAAVDTPFGKRVQCRCCGYLTLETYGHYDICRVCRWEDDPTTIFDPDEPGGPGPNYISLTEGRANFEATGTSDHRGRVGERVRDPLPEEYPPAGQGRPAAE